MSKLPVIEGDRGATPPVRELCALLGAHGCWFNPDLLIRLREGQIGLFSRHPHQDRRSYIRLPLSLMPCQDDFHFSLSNGGLGCQPLTDRATAPQQQIMQAVVALYNANSKLEWWGQTFPLLALEDHPELLTAICQAKTHNPKLNKYLALAAQGEREKLLVESFLGSRVFRLTGEQRRRAGLDERKQSEDLVTLPVIDLFNHRIAAEPYVINHQPPPSSMRVFARPDPESGELFVRYNLYDAVDTYLFYGFVDSTAPWLGSIPMVLEAGGRVRYQVLNTGAASPGKLPKNLQDLRLLMPNISRRKGVACLSRLLIPGPAAPRSLQRILAHLVRRQLSEVGQNELLTLVAALEEQLIEANLQWWRHLSKKVGTLAEEHPLAQLCRQSTAHIERYRKERPAIERR